MTQKENISVVIPTYNRVDILKKVIPLYLNQTYLKEIIIVNDNSSDDTEIYIKSLAKKYKKIRYIKNNKNKGASKSRNIGIQEAKGNYLFITEDDVKLESDYLSKLLEDMKKDNADIIAGRLIEMQKEESEESALQRADKLKYPPLINYKSIMTNFQIKTKGDMKVPILNGVMLIKKEVFKKVKYDEIYEKNYWREETDFQLSALKEGYKICFCPHVYGYHLYKPRDKGGCHTQSILKREYWIIKNNYLFVKKHNSFLIKTFHIKNLYLYLFTFTLSRIVKIPLLFAVELKRRLLD